MLKSFYWHDYETFGADPVRDRPSQFAGIRTDKDLNIIEEPLVIYCRPSDDYVPSPEACMITGITPQKAQEEGLCESEFIGQINEAFSQPGTCAVGYNNLRFDDEVTRHTLYRNLRDPYAREWQNGNSRWDLIDVVRLTYALRPEGIEWPRKEDGSPSFRLEELTQANGLEHGQAHDAMSDVHATIALARLIREKQPRLFEYALSHRDKRSVAAMLDVDSMKPVFHVSSRYPASQGCCAMVAPLAWHPVNRNAVIVYDLRVDPSRLLSMSADAIRERLYTKTEDLAEGEERIPLKAIHINKCPVLAPAAMLKTLSSEKLDSLALDGDLLRENLQQLRTADGLGEKIREVFSDAGPEGSSDPDEMLYGGGFLSPQDRKQLDFVLQQPPEMLGELDLRFQDERLEEMLFRYRARNYPGTLTGEEQERWEAFRQQRLLKPSPPWLSLPAYFKKLETLAQDENVVAKHQGLLQDLQFYGESLIPYV
ncbi:exodeoxyribonuclease I [Marinobacteraceae bacterium S3BR75-40.1]